MAVTGHNGSRSRTCSVAIVAQMFAGPLGDLRRLLMIEIEGLG